VPPSIPARHPLVGASGDPSQLRVNGMDPSIGVDPTRSFWPSDFRCPPRGAPRVLPIVVFQVPGAPALDSGQGWPRGTAFISYKGPPSVRRHRVPLDRHQRGPRRASSARLAAGPFWTGLRSRTGRPCGCVRDLTGSVPEE